MSSTATWLLARGIGDYVIVHKFGMDSAVGTAFEPCSDDGLYETPLVNASVALRVKAGNTNDTAAGSGARSVRLTGLDETGVEVTEVIATAGTSASAVTSVTFSRLFRISVETSGTHADPDNATYSHAAAIIIEDASANEWGKIVLNSAAHGQSQIGCYTVPSALSDGTVIKEAYITDYTMGVDSGKVVDFMLWKREGLLTLVAPFDAFKVVREHIGETGTHPVPVPTPLGPFPPGTDIGFLVKGATSPVAIVDFTIALVKA